MPIKINNANIAKLYLGNIAVKRAYSNMAIVYDTGAPEPCFEVVNTISQASGDYVDVYVQSESKWYKRNNLNQFEEYGLMPVVDDLQNTTKYVGKLVILNTDTHEYKWNGSTWVDLGDAGSLTEYIFMDPPTSNDHRYAYPIRYYFGTGYHMKILMYVSGVYTSDTGSFLNMANKSPIEFNQYNNGFYVDFHNPTSTTSPSVYLGDYSTRVMANRAFVNYKDTKMIVDIEFNKITVTNFDTGAQIYTSGSSATVTGWYDGLYEPVNYPFYNNPSHVAYIQVYDNNGNLVNDLRPKYNENPSDVKDTITWYDSVIQAEYYNDNSYTANYHKESIGSITPVEEYDTKVPPADNVHYNTLAELELMECPWYGMRASVGENYVWYKYTTDGWVLADMPLDLPYLRFMPTADSTFTFSKSGLKYSIDGAAWADLIENVATPTVQAGHYIMFKGDNPTISSTYGIGTFSATGNFDASGNIMSLIFDDDFSDKTSLDGKNYVFKSLFAGNKYVKNCTGLLLPATTLANYCYQNMFGSSGVNAVSPTMLPATVCTQYCYATMFNGASSLTTPPELPATTLAAYCYYTMFGQTSLTTLPELPATQMVSHCYDTMFNYVNANIPENYLPSTQLAPGCYAAMFANSNYRTKAMSILPATTLYEKCYDTMFINNRSLTKVPILPAEKLASMAYQYIFSGCPITSIVALFTSTPSSSYTLNWVNGVAANGTFYKNPNATWDQTITRGSHTVPDSWTITDVKTNEYLTLTPTEDVGCAFKFSVQGVQYSTDKTNWYDLSTDTYTQRFAKNTHVYFRGNITPRSDGASFTTSDNVIASGDPRSILYGEWFNCYYTIPDYAFCKLFANTKVVDASALILDSVNLTEYCYADMFRGATRLVSAPNIPNTSSRERSFSYMFSGCTSLVNSPAAIYLGNYLRSAEYMFSGCTSLVESPIIKGVYVALNGAVSMFSGCTSLNKVTYLCETAPSSERSATWLSNVSATGTFYMDENQTWDQTVPRNGNGVPADWTIVKIDPTSV